MLRPLIGPLPEHLACGSRFHLLAEVDAAKAETDAHYWALTRRAASAGAGALRAMQRGFARARWAREALRRLAASKAALAAEGV